MCPREKTICCLLLGCDSAALLTISRYVVAYMLVPNVIQRPEEVGGLQVQKDRTLAKLQY